MTLESYDSSVQIVESSGQTLFIHAHGNSILGSQLTVKIGLEVTMGTKTFLYKPRSSRFSKRGMALNQLMSSALKNM